MSTSKLIRRITEYRQIHLGECDGCEHAHITAHIVSARDWRVLVYCTVSARDLKRCPDRCDSRSSDPS